MKPGRRIANPASKQLAGTYRKDRHDNIVELATPPRNVPVRPSYMTVEGRLIWDEELPRVIACGVTEADSSLLARYCECEAAFRVAIMAGTPPQAATMTELRRMAELLGIAGLRSRLGKATTDTPVKSTFSVLKK
jgi:hypothetical protein